MHPHEVMEAVQQLKKEGKIINFGVSNFTPTQVALLSSEVLVDVNQIEFSVVQCKALFDGSLDQTIKDNITPMAWAPLGSLFTTESSLQKKRILDQLALLSDKYNATPRPVSIGLDLKAPRGNLSRYWHH